MPHFFSNRETMCPLTIYFPRLLIKPQIWKRDIYISKVLEGSISSWGLLRRLQHPWSHPFSCPLIIVRNGIYFLPLPEKIQLRYSKITWWMMGNWIFMNLVQHGEAWLTIHKGQNLNNSHDFKNNQEEKICRKVEQSAYLFSFLRTIDMVGKMRFSTIFICFFLCFDEGGSR